MFNKITVVPQQYQCTICRRSHPTPIDAIECFDGHMQPGKVKEPDDGETKMVS